MHPIRFRDEEHERFYHQMLAERKCNDGYHRALFFTHWAFPGKLGVMYVICLIFLTAALIPRAFRPHGKPAVPFEYVGSPLIYGTGGPNQVGNASPLPTNYSIAATPLSFSRQFIFVIRNISEVRKRFSNGYLNKPAEQIPIVGGA